MDKRTPDELMKDYDDGCKGLRDIDMHSILWEIIEDIQDSYLLAMERSGIVLPRRIQIEAIVSDYLASHYGDD